ncbi:MAG: hypothetical protein KA004_11800 [Verrucomicrobiales bacterium]|nr:hypothetical protein [Verrucomicrobiales bacterium]
MKLPTATIQTSGGAAGGPGAEAGQSGAYYESAPTGLLGLEQFDYPDGPIASRNGGAFWNWRNQTPAGRTAGVSDWDNDTGTPAIASGRLITQNNSATREYNGPGEGLPITTDEGLGAISAFDNGSLSFRHKVVYCRVTLTTGASVTPDASIGIRSLDFGTERVVFGKKAGSTTFGIEESGVSNTNSTTAVAPNTTYTLVTKLDFGNGSTGIASLFLDPDLNAVEPAPLVTRAFNASLWSTSVNLRSGGGSPIAWDDLVVAASWDELGTVVTTATDEDNGSLNPAAGTGVSLREAVKFSPSGTLITFAPGLSGQTITLTHPDGDMEIPNSVTIDAAALPGGLTLSGNNVTRHFQVPIRTFLTLRGLALTDGHPDGDGGAIYNQGWLTADRCSFSGNISTSDGGAILNTSGGTMTLTHCTLSGNTAKYGGAILGDDAALTLTHCTLSGNSAATVGGALLSIGSTLTLTNSILAGNTANSAPDFHQDIGVLFTNGVNLIGNLTDSGLTAGPTILTGDAKLSPLGHFGGPVMTMHPLIGSPAIDAAGSTDPGGTDARGFPRFVDGNDASAGAQLDIGAVEAGLLLKVLASGDGGGATLRSTLALINAASTQGLRVAFDPALFPASTITLAGSNELTAPAGKAFFIDASNLTGPVTISGNNASRVFNIPATATVAMHSVNIVNGKATILSHGGGILNGGRLTMEACRVENNRSVDSADGSLPLPGGSGGGIRNTGILSMTNSRITGNQTGRGGNATGTDESGARSGNGGGISNRGILTLTDCAVADNATGQGGNATPGGTGTGGYGVGGGVSHEGASARFTATRCSFTGNHADRNGRDGNGQVRTDGAPGGGIDAHAAMTLESCTIAGNFSADTSYGGGGVALFDDTVVLRHCTVANNTTTGPGAGIFCFHSTQLTLQNCVVAGNITPDSIKDLRIPNTTTYVGANLLGTAASGSGTPTGPAPIINANPLLAPLGDYGGRTQTMPPRPGSPAIDAGTTTTLLTDQRGLPRTRDGDGNGTALPDLGAVEASHVLVTNTSDTGTGSLRAALTEAAAQPGADTVFFTSAVTPHITLASEILITDPAGVTIDASDRPTGIVIDGGPGANRHFRIDPTSIVTLQRLQLTGGNGGGGGSPASYGGSIFNGGSLTVRECTLHGNTSGIAGAIYNQAGALTVERSTFHSNTATNVGAILHESLTPMLITASTFTNNNGGLEGGAITVSNFRPATLTHCTISGNRVTQTGGGGGGGIRTIAGAGNLLTLGQSIVSGNTDANTPGTPDINPGFISQGDNVIGGDARLSPLLDFGGPTWTMALRPGSIARNAAFTSTATFDQRGYSIIGPADIGAYEASNPWLFNYNAYIWESLPPTATAAQAASAFDFDGDGQSNEDEWLAFTTATDPGSVFAFTGHVLNGLNMEISFLSVTGRTYDVEASNDLVTWANLGTFPGHGGTLVLPIGPVGADQRMFFRIRPRLP